MTDIKFARDYGYSPASPFWLVCTSSGATHPSKHNGQGEAEAEAAKLARENPGRLFYVLAVVSSISTSEEVVGTRFDPNKSPPLAEFDVAPVPEFKAEPDEVIL